ncbi:MAG: hypothetical protein CMP66_02700 [Flavobacteriales bacterium]|nr:hypothetical protein [Flavobacteriales bacterium]|tara:strand:+ start:271 stop:492 length:222 start_codon:yes stop_codon:yes gene_type:complete
MNFTFGKRNYQLLIAGVIVMAIGFVLMSGGGSEDPNVFSNAIFNTQRLTIAPILILTGLVIEVFAILHKPKED